MLLLNLSSRWKNTANKQDNAKPDRCHGLKIFGLQIADSLMQMPVKRMCFARLAKYNDICGHNQD